MQVWPQNKIITKEPLGGYLDLQSAAWEVPPKHLE